jgi:transcriptional regulator with XRE-family HTH domain
MTIRLTAPEHAGIAVRDLRRMSGLRQADLCGLTGISPQQHGQYESGRRVPGVGTLIRLANALGYDLALVEREDEVDPAVEHVSAEAIADVLAIVDAPYRSGLDVRLEEDDDPWPSLMETYPGSGIYE